MGTTFDKTTGHADSRAVRRYLEALLDAAERPATAIDFDGLEAEFIRAAGPYGRQNGISYKAWLAVGVERRVLRAAGVNPGRDLDT
jgi:hypothetical protein